MSEGVVPFDFVEINDDQRRESVNTRQRFSAWQDAAARLSAYRGSLVWHRSNDTDYLQRSYYDASGLRRQKVEGQRNDNTEKLKANWETGRHQAAAREKQLRELLERQAAVNRALNLGRVPLISARIMRAIDRAGLLGNGIRVVGTNAIYAYEAAAGIMVDPGITSTLDIDLLFDARRSLKFAGRTDIPEGTLMGLLRKVDTSFERTGQTFTAVNRDGYLVDLIRPERNPPWWPERATLGNVDDDLHAVQIGGLSWLENASAFEATAIDERGAPVRIVASDPRVFAVHKLWMSNEQSREPIKRRRDAAQARVTAALVSRYLTHLPIDAAELRMLPLELCNKAKTIFDFGERGSQPQ